MRMTVLSAISFFIVGTAAAMNAKIALKSAIDITARDRIIYSYGNLRRGMLVTRYKRFLADIDFETASSPSETSIPSIDEAKDAAVTVVHCPNTGSMYNLIPPANVSPQCACSTAPEGTKRKYVNTLEMIRENNAWVGVHSALANKMVEKALYAK